MSAVNCSGQTERTTRAMRGAWWLCCTLQWVDFNTTECSSWSHSKCLRTQQPTEKSLTHIDYISHIYISAATIETMHCAKNAKMW